MISSSLSHTGAPPQVLPSVTIDLLNGLAEDCSFSSSVSRAIRIQVWSVLPSAHDVLPLFVLCAWPLSHFCLA